MNADPKRVEGLATPSGKPSSPAPIEEAAASPRLLILMVGLIVGWFSLMQRFGSRSNIYAVMGPFALTVALVIGALSSRPLVRWLRPTRRALLGGLLIGVGMTLVTYPAFALLRSLVPTLGSQVAVLYAAAHQTTLAEALPWVVAIIVAEELLWRGALLHVLEHRVSPRLAMVLSVASYAAAQFGTGSWIVMLLALVCGSLWTVQRHFTRSLLSPSSPTSSGRPSSSSCTRSPPSEGGPGDDTAGSRIATSEKPRKAPLVVKSFTNANIRLAVGQPRTRLQIPQ